MRRFLPVAAVCLPLMLACSPYTFTLSVELRDTTPSGLNLSGKNISVVSLDNGERGDSLFLAGVSESFVGQLEKDYFWGEQRVGLFRILKDAKQTEPSKETMLDYLIESGSDVVFAFSLNSMGPVSFGNMVQSGMIDSADSAFVLEAAVPFDIALYVYDSMAQKDTVLTFLGNSEVRPKVYTSGKDVSVSVLEDKVMSSMFVQGLAVGRQSSRIFLSEWKQTDFSLYHYDSGTWLEASRAAADYDWRKAMDGWMSMLDTPNLQKRSCLEYNLAVVNAIIGEKSLAQSWLDRSDADYPLPQSSSLRRRINKMR
ncbi:MAG: hypothetical protein ACI395_06640 [Candidatus Cryptobacteroides sp.]